MMKKLLALGALCALTLMAGQVWADVIATRVRTTSDVFTDGAVHPIPLNNGGSTAMAFVTTRDNQRVVISYNAECSVQAANFSTWLNLDILVDGVLAAPSSNDNAFCTSHGNNGLDGWVSAVTTVVFVVPEPGIHNVQVRGTLIGFVAGNLWRIDDSSTVVMN